MKLDRKVDAGIVDSNGAVTTSSFSIATSSHMFHILSSGLYADKIKAVVREIGCNAMDAHIMANKPNEPIEVKLPNQLDPTFYVKDFGPGLDEDEIRQLYTTYGWSAKQDSDEVTGAFGLGSKSPFAYTHSFTVQSSKNGRMWTMTAHQDEDGKPVITKVAEADAPEDWPSGVMVTMAVEPSDFNEFEYKAQEVFRWFAVKPRILGSAITLEEPKYDFRWKNFGFSKDGRGASVVMGNVRYPLDTHILREKCKLDDAAAGLLERTLNIWLPIGSAMMTPSRESLEYTKKTVETLRAALQEASSTLYESVLESLKVPASSELEMHRRVYALRESFPHSVKKALDESFDAASDDIKALAEATWKQYIHPMVQLEQWVGEGASPLPPYQRDANGKLVIDESTGRPLVDASWKPSGARVYALVLGRKSRRSSVRASKREVVGGRFANTSDESQKLSMHIDRIPPVYVLDSTVGFSALKLHFENGKNVDSGTERVEAIVVVGTGKDGLEKAQAYAQRLIGETIVFAENVPMRVSEHHASEIDEVRRSRKRYANRTREDWLAQAVYEASLTTVAANDELAVSTTTLEEFEEANEERYYLLSYKTGDMKFSAQGYDSEVAQSRLVRAIRSGVISHLAKVAGLDTESVILLQNKAQLKALKLVENGYKEFFATLMTAIHADPEKRQLLGEQMEEPVPGYSAYTYGHDRSRLGLVGALTKQKRKDSVLWQRISQRYPYHPVVQAAIAYDALLDKDGNPVDRYKPLREFVGNVSYARAAMGLTGSTVDKYALFDQAHSALPHWEILDLDKMAQMAETDGETVATLLDVVFLLGANLSQAAGITKKAA